MYKEYKNMDNEMLMEESLINKLRDMETYMEWYEKMEESLAISYEILLLKNEIDEDLYDFGEYVLDSWSERYNDITDEEQEKWRAENFR